jgi:CRISPR-associated protein Cas1
MQLHLQSFGSKLRVREGLFEVLSFGKKDQLIKEQFPPHQVDSIWMQKQTSVSSDAIMLATENNVGIIIVNKFGFPVGRFISSKPSSTSLIQKNQLRVSIDHHGTGFVKEWVAQKLENQSKFIYGISRNIKGEDKELALKCVNRLKELKNEIGRLEGNNIQEIAETIRGLEGTGGRMYFRTISALLPRQHQFDKRSRMPALDPYNAFLNYAYAILYSRIESALFGAGLNPYIGFLHRDGYNYQGLVFDFIEPYRVWMDKVVFRLFTKKNIQKKHVEKKEQGLWVSTEGKRLLIHAINDFFKFKKETFRGKTHHPDYILPAQAKAFATVLKGMYTEEIVKKDE